MTDFLSLKISKKAVSLIPRGSKSETRWIFIYSKSEDSGIYAKVCHIPKYF